MIPGDIWKGENLSYIDNPESVAEAETTMFAALKNSETHMKNMLFEEFSQVGIAAYFDNNKEKLTVAYMFCS